MARRGTGREKEAKEGKREEGVSASLCVCLVFEERVDERGENRPAGDLRATRRGAEEEARGEEERWLAREGEDEEKGIEWGWLPFFGEKGGREEFWVLLGEEVEGRSEG